MAAITDPNATLPTIADVERDTGIAKDTLRVWERRYGFPQPLRDANGERRYPADQIQRLRLTRRLMDAGMRPNRLMVLDADELERELGVRSADIGTGSPLDNTIDEVLTLTTQHQPPALRMALAQLLARHGLQRFVIDLLPLLLRRTGDHWLRGNLGVAEEHMLTEALQNLLRAAIHQLPRHRQDPPHVLLTSLPDEEHGLGLLMVEALLESEQCGCTTLGLRTPVPDIVTASRWAPADIVAVSVSAAYPPRKALATLTMLRQELSPTTTLWVGGAGALATATSIIALPATRLIAHIADTLPALSAWRQERGVR